MPRFRNRRSLGFERMTDRCLPSTIFVTDVIVPPFAETEIEIRARGSGSEPLVRALNLRAQLGDGLGPNLEPLFKSVSYEETIWTNHPVDVVGGVVEHEPQFVQSTIVLKNPMDASLVASGLIAKVTIDTRDIDSGSFELRLNSTPFPDTDFGQIKADIVNGTIHIAVPGDSNLDSRFDSADLVQVLTRGEYEDNTPLNSDWFSGDWDGNGDFTSGDFVHALTAGHYVFG